MTTIEWLLILAFIILVMIVKSRYDARRWESRRRYWLQERFGTANQDEYYQKRYEMIDYYHNRIAAYEPYIYAVTEAQIAEHAASVAATQAVWLETDVYVDGSAAAWEMGPPQTCTCTFTS